MAQEQTNVRLVLANLQAQAQSQEAVAALQQLEQEINAAEERANQMQEQLQNHQQQQQQQQQHMQQLQQQVQQLQQLQQQQGAQQPGTLQAAKVKIQRPVGFEGKYSDLENFLFRVEQYYAVVGVTDAYEQVRFAVTLLTGSALTWWRSMAQQQWAQLGHCTWTAFKDKLREQFTDVDVYLKARRRLAQLRQTATVAAYTNAFRSTLLEVGDQKISDSDILFTFVEGLNQNIKQQVLMQRPNTFVEACLLAERAGSVLQSGYVKSGNQNKWSSQRVASSSQAQPMELGVMDASTRDLSKLKCWKCGEKGHTKKQCPKLNQKNVQ